MCERSDRLYAAGAFADITPAELLPLAGYSDRSINAAQVADRLEADAVVLRQDATLLVFVSCDLLFVGRPLRSRLEELLADCVSPGSLFVSATHTHFAPATNPTMPRLGRASSTYVETVATTISSLVRGLINSTPQAVNILYKAGRADHAIHRRLPVAGPRLGLPPLGYRWEMRPNRDVSIDERIRVLSLGDDEGRPIAICWSYACHPVCFPERMQVSADFPGVVRKAVRARFGNIPVLFWQGFAGDVRPRAVGIPKETVAGRRELPEFVPFTSEQWKHWTTGLSACVLSALQTAGQKTEGKIGASRRQFPVSELGLRCRSRNISVHEVRLGDNLELFGISAELVNGYVARLESIRTGTTIIPVGCIDDVSCYVPTDEMVGQGGYEVAGFRRLFGVSGRFRNDVCAVIDRQFERTTSP